MSRVLGVVVMVLLASLVLFCIGMAIGTFQRDRALADECYEMGGIPVQGDSAGSSPVICLDDGAVIGGAK